MELKIAIVSQVHDYQQRRYFAVFVLLSCDRRCFQRCFGHFSDQQTCTSLQCHVWIRFCWNSKFEVQHSGTLLYFFKQELGNFDFQCSRQNQLTTYLVAGDKREMYILILERILLNKEIYVNFQYFGPFSWNRKAVNFLSAKYIFFFVKFQQCTRPQS